MMTCYILDCGHTHAVLAVEEPLSVAAQSPTAVLCGTCQTWSVLLERADPADLPPPRDDDRGVVLSIVRRPR